LRIGWRSITSSSGWRRGDNPARARSDDVHAELLAQPADEDLDGVGVAVEVLIVEMLRQLAPGDDAAHVVHEVGQEPVFVGGQLHRIAVHGDAAGAGVELDRTAGDLAGGVAGGAAQQGAHPGEKLLHVEGLGHVVVGPGVEALHLVAPAVAGREDDDGGLAAVAPPGGQDGHAVHLGQAEIEDDGVVGFRIPQELPLLAVERGVDRVARLFEGGHDLLIEDFVVLDNEKAHVPGFP
jgi:hypothetical protein